MSCADVQTIQAGNASKTQFSFDFPYIFKSEIKVSLWNATTKEWDEIAQSDATYPWQITDANPTIVEFTSTAPPAPAVPVDPGEPSVDNVRIRRVTNIDDIRALFNPGSAIRSDDLNKNFEQLRYAIQEANCQDVPDEIYEFLENYYWNNFDETLYSSDTWVSNNSKIATTQSIDQRIDSKIDSALTVDIGASDGITITDNSPAGGQIVVGIGANSVDLDRIKNEDILTYTEEVAGSPSWDSDNRIPTTYAALQRFDTLVQVGTPSGSNWPVGKTWLQNDEDLTLSIWNGSSWIGIASGGTFTNLPKVVYVDSVNGNDANDGHRISGPKQTIKAAINQINADAAYGDGSVVVVAPGTYQEIAPIDIQKANVSIVGAALRSCIIHPTVATETNSLFRVNSGSYLKNLTFTGVKASGIAGNTVDPALPVNQGWNVSFYPGATIYKSPYIQNCTNFSDSEIDNSNINVITPAGGAAGDTDSAPTGGGLLVDGSVVDSNSPLRSMVCDSYTHVGLNGPAILVTNNGYCQATSSYAFFTHYHIKCRNGGQANLAASTSDFGDYSLIADGKSPTAIFTSNVDGAADDLDITFNINEPVAAAGWHGSATRPQDNMLVEVNGEIYPVLSAVAHTDSEGGDGWTVTISRPNPTNKTENLGLDGAVSDDAAVNFYLRSMIASSGHTMEYVGSGTDYSALPENGGVPIESRQITELNNGKVWAAITDHRGKFSLGDFFSVDQNSGVITMDTGSVQLDLNTLLVTGTGYAQIGAKFDMNGNEISDLSGNLELNSSTGVIDVQTNKIVNLGTPTAASDAATKNYVDTTLVGFLTPADIGVTVQAYDADTAKYDAVTANFTGTLQNGGSNVVVDSDIGVTVQAYDATILKSADIGVTVEAYDATILKSADIGVTVQGYDATLLNSADIGVTVQGYDATYLKSADIGVTVQGYDADTVKTDVLPTFTVATRTTERTITAGAFDLATGNLWTVGAITVPNPTNAVAGQTGAIRITAGPVVWSGNFKFPGGTAPTIATFPAIIPYYVQNASTILMGNVTEGIA